MVVTDAESGGSGRGILRSPRPPERHDGRLHPHENAGPVPQRFLVPRLLPRSRQLARREGPTARPGAGDAYFRPVPVHRSRPLRRQRHVSAMEGERFVAHLGRERGKARRRHVDVWHEPRRRHRFGSGAGRVGREGQREARHLAAGEGGPDRPPQPLDLASGLPRLVGRGTHRFAVAAQLRHARREPQTGTRKRRSRGSPRPTRKPAGSSATSKRSSTSIWSKTSGTRPTATPMWKSPASPASIHMRRAATLKPRPRQWVFVAQVDRQAALAPLEDLRTKIVRVGAVAGATLAMIAVGLWIGLVIVLRRLEGA